MCWSNFAGSLFFFFFSVNIMFSKYYGMENTKTEEMMIVDKRMEEMEIKEMKINHVLMISWNTSLLTLDLIHANLHFYLKMESFVFQESPLTHKSRKCNWSDELDLLQRQKLSAEKIPEENHSNLYEASVRASQTWWWWEYQQPLASNPHPFLLSYKTGSWKQSWK